MRIHRNHNYRVVVEPKRLGNLGFLTVSDERIEPDPEKREQEYKSRCESIIDQIKRHVDSVGWVGLVWDAETRCSYCGHVEDGDPDCCNRAIAEREEKHGP